MNKNIQWSVEEGKGKAWWRALIKKITKKDMCDLGEEIRMCPKCVSSILSNEEIL